MSQQLKLEQISEGIKEHFEFGKEKYKVKVGIARKKNNLAIEEFTLQDFLQEEMQRLQDFVNGKLSYIDNRQAIISYCKITDIVNSIAHGSTESAIRKQFYTHKTYIINGPLLECLKRNNDKNITYGWFIDKRKVEDLNTKHPYVFVVNIEGKEVKWHITEKDLQNIKATDPTFLQISRNRNENIQSNFNTLFYEDYMKKMSIIQEDIESTKIDKPKGGEILVTDSGLKIVNKSKTGSLIASPIIFENGKYYIVDQKGEKTILQTQKDKEAKGKLKNKIRIRDSDYIQIGYLGGNPYLGRIIKDIFGKTCLEYIDEKNNIKRCVVNKHMNLPSINIDIKEEEQQIKKSNQSQQIKKEEQFQQSKKNSFEVGDIYINENKMVLIEKDEEGKIQLLPIGISKKGNFFINRGNNRLEPLKPGKSVKNDNFKSIAKTKNYSFYGIGALNGHRLFSKINDEQKSCIILEKDNEGVRKKKVTVSELKEPIDIDNAREKLSR